MSETDRTVAPPARLREIIGPFRGPDDRRSLIQLALTATLFVLSWTAAYLALQVHYALTLLLVLPTGGFLMRLFMIQHDCGHGSYFSSKTARDAVGFVIGVLTLTPYHYWKRTHAHHHAHSGDLDFRGFGDIETLTVREYRALPPLRRFAYRAYRNPLILLGIGPVFHFLIKHRYPWDIPRSWKKEWAGIWATNVALVAVVALMSWAVGWKAFLLVQVPVTLLTCSLGVWLFYVQHQFEDTYWHEHEQWDFYEASLRGSSHLVLPRPLQWLTAHIGVHHVHHLNSMIPNYRLQACHDANPELQVARKITVRDGWRLLRLNLWDEEARRLVGFREARLAG
jgi:omega-6 fatty acid desaturase (delta-12 desaturase)